jgi:alpha-glucosidase
VPFAGADVGGFAGDCSPELLLRWYELGIFYPFFRNHCRMGQQAQEPWAHGQEIEDKIKVLLEARYRLLPYIYNLFRQHWLTGAPLMRPLSWHFGDDPLCWEIDDQFLLGPDILVAPVLQRQKNHRSVYFPAGRWHSFQRTECFEGSGARMVHLPAGSVPAFVRDGAILPLADALTDTSSFDSCTITFVVYGQQGQTRFYEDDGQTLDYRSGAFNEWQLNYADGRLDVQVVHRGYKCPGRRYLVQAAQHKQVQPVELGDR